MEVIKTAIDGLVIIEPKVFQDARGYFFESFSQREFEEKVRKVNFVQDNESRSKYGVVRGFHFQRPPHAQAKLVRVVRGRVIDVAVDIRVGSPTYGKWYGVELDADSKTQFLIPRGFAHGFSVLSETAVFTYKCDNLYNAQLEGGVMFNDPDLNIDWGIPADKQLISEKDLKHPLFKDLKTNFVY